MWSNSNVNQSTYWVFTQGRCMNKHVLPMECYNVLSVTTKASLRLRRAMLFAVSICILLLTSELQAAAPDANDGPRYAVSQLYLDFADDLPVHPPGKVMLEMEVTLGETSEGYVSPRQDVTCIKVKLKNIYALKQKFMYESAIKTISAAVVDYFREWGYGGIICAPDESDISLGGKDLRLQGQTALRLVVRSMVGRGISHKADQEWDGPADIDGGTYPLNQVLIELSRNLSPDIAKAVKISDMEKLIVTIGQTKEGYVATRRGVKTVAVRVGDLQKLDDPQVFFESGLYSLCEQLTDSLHARGLGGVYVWANPLDIDANGKDTRYTNQTVLRLLVQGGDLPKPVVPEAVKMAQAAAAEIKELPTALPADGKLYQVNQIILTYAKDYPGLLNVNDVIMNTEISLGEAKDGYTAPRPDGPTVRLRVSDLSTLPTHELYGSAIRYINIRLVKQFNRMGYIGIDIRPHAEDINASGNDIRTGGRTALRMVIRTGVLAEMRTLASGDRVPDADRVNNPLHAKIAKESPIQPRVGDVVAANNLLRKDLLDEYVYRLNRHPGRRVDVAVSAAKDVGDIALDYLITEAKPWTGYVQLSNTGTDQTRVWRERFGYVNNQLTGNDDILKLDYITAGFDKAHTVIASYEPRWFDRQTTRCRVGATYSEFTASDVGMPGFDFNGDQWKLEGEIINNIWHENEKFLDFIVGVQLEKIAVNGDFGGATFQSGKDDFFMPRIGLRYEQKTDTSTTFGSGEFCFNLANLVGTDDDPGSGGVPASGSAALGRLMPDKDFMILRWDISHSFFLEPWLHRAQWEDASTPESSTLAHELFLAFKGQFAFNTRLVPQHQYVVGGAYSVRGYSESITSGDSALLGSLEYRYHVPRAFAIKPEPGSAPIFGAPFRWAPQQVYGQPDWDLILRGFFDYARTFNSERLVNSETDDQLVSVGLGTELVLKRNFSLRIDWGLVLSELQDRESVGHNAFHVVGTLLY